MTQSLLLPASHRCESGRTSMQIQKTVWYMLDGNTSKVDMDVLILYFLFQTIQQNP